MVHTPSADEYESALRGALRKIAASGGTLELQNSPKLNEFGHFYDFLHLAFPQKI